MIANYWKNLFSSPSSTNLIRNVEVDETNISIKMFYNISIIGIGGFGMVRKVRKLVGSDYGKEYAMKCISKEMILKRSSGANIVYQELNCLMLLLDCKYTCNIHYAFQDCRYIYFVLDLADGGDLRTKVITSPDKRLSEEFAKYYISQVIEALSFCHQKNILHRGHCYYNYYFFSSFNFIIILRFQYIIIYIKILSQLIFYCNRMEMS